MSESGSPQRILFINVSRIGDTLLCIPTLRAISERYPDAQLDVLAHPNRMEVLQNLPGVHHVGAITKVRAPLLGRLSCLLGKPYDVAFVCNYDQPLVRYALRVAKEVVAFEQSDPTLNQLLYRAVGAALPSEHAVQRTLRLTMAYGIPPTTLALQYRVTEDEAAWAANFLRERQLSGTHPLIGLQVASFPTKAYRDWPLENFIALCTRVREAYPAAHFLIFGGSLEQNKTEQLATALGTAATLCAGKLSLRETAALMNRIDLYVGVDTGPTHLMGALQRPMVALYHAASPSSVYGALENPNTHIIDHPLAGKVAHSNADQAPMSDISLATVWQAVEQALHTHA